MNARSLAIAAFALVAFVMPALVQAADKGPDGTWKWSTPGRNGGAAVDTVLKLKVDGEKVTGTISGRDGKDTAIEEGKFAGGTVTFSVTREFNGQKNTSKYEAKVDGDALKGKITTERNGQARSRDFEAKREAAKAA